MGLLSVSLIPITVENLIIENQGDSIIRVGLASSPNVTPDRDVPQAPLSRMPDLGQNSGNIWVRLRIVRLPTVKWNDDIYNIPAYPVKDAAGYLHIPVRTLRSWLEGRSYPTKGGQQAFEPLIQRPHPDYPQLSFTNLVEAHVLRIIRETHQVKLDKVRKALDYIGQQFNTPHPLVMKRFQTDGVDLFVDQVDQLVNVSRSGQLAMRETLKHLLTRVEWNADGIASRFFPVVDLVPEPGSDRLIFIDPSIQFGKPVIAGRGVPTRAIVSLIDAGDSIEDVADEFGCAPAQVKAAIQFETQNRAA